MSAATCNIVPPFIGVLIKGFLGTDQGCFAACHDALATLGKNVEPALRQAACRASSVQRNRLSHLLHTIENRLYQSRQLDAELMKALMACVSGMHPELRKLSLELLRQFPREDTLQMLVRRATELVHRPARCIRLLDAVQALGGCPRGAAFMQLTTLQLAGHRGIRQAARNLYKSVVFGPSTVVDAGGSALPSQCQEAQTPQPCGADTQGAVGDVNEQDDNCPLHDQEWLG